MFPAAHLLNFIVLFSILFGCTVNPEIKPLSQKNPTNADFANSIIDTNSCYKEDLFSRLGVQFRHLNTRNGLSSDEINCIYQDNIGFIWICTANGLNRYDGHDIVFFNEIPGDSSSLLDTECQKIKQDQNGDFWVLSLNGITYINHHNFGIKRYPYPPKFKVTFTQNPDFFISNDNKIYIKHVHATFNINQRCWIPILSVSENHIINYVQNEDKSIFRYESYTIQKSTSHTRVIITNLTSNKILKDTIIDHIKLTTLVNFNQIGITNQSLFWYGTQDGNITSFDYKKNILKLYNLGFKLEGTNSTAKDYICGSIKSMYFDHHCNIIFFGTWCGLIALDIRCDTISQIKRFVHDPAINSSINGQIVVAVMKDNQGGLWIGTNTNGVSTYNYAAHKNTQISTLIVDKKPIEITNVNALEMDSSDNIWIGSQFGLYSYHPNTNRSEIVSINVHPKYSLNPNMIQCLYYDQETSNLYIGPWGAPMEIMNTYTHKFKPQILDFNKNTAPLYKNYFNSFILKAPDDFIFVGNYGSGLIYYQYKNNIFNYTPSIPNFEGLPSCGILYNNRVWLNSTNNPNIFILDYPKSPFSTNPNSKFVDNITNDTVLCTITEIINSTNTSGLISSDINSFYKDSKNNLWLATNKGLSLLINENPPTFKTYNIKSNSVGYPIINSIIEDSTGVLWLTSSSSILSFNPKTDSSLTLYARNINAGSFSANCVKKDQNGNFWFGNQSGICMINPYSPRINNHIPTPIVSAYELDGLRKLEIPQQLNLESDYSSLKLFLSALDYCDPNSNSFEYSISNDGKTKYFKNESNIIQLNQLSYGQHLIEINCQNNDHIVSSTKFTLNILVKTPWWKSGFFNIFLLFSFLGFLYLLYRINDRKLRQKVKDDERKIKYLQIQTLQSQINPHFIFNVMGAMQNQIINNEPKKANDHLIKLSTLIRRFLDSSVTSSNFNAQSRVSKISLTHEMELLRMYCEFEQFQKPGKFDFKINCDTITTPGNIYIPPMIIQPFVENSIKHGLLYKDSKGLLVIQFSQDTDQYLNVVIMDNGVGRKKSAEIQKKSLRLYKSYGTILVNERIEIMNQIGFDIKITTEDIPNGGTLVTLKINQ
ncbi:MAG: histidine kinase [Saprospiraceae bacterium]|jgi:ligand-binding sensor domain-containing protein|nr:histidine kinase [Saprospiraceae bacterium]